MINHSIYVTDQQQLIITSLFSLILLYILDLFVGIFLSVSTASQCTFILRSKSYCYPKTMTHTELWDNCTVASVVPTLSPGWLISWAPVLLYCRYHALVSKYGQLAPLAEVDLRPRGTMVDVRWGERVEAVSLRMEQTVGDLRKQLRALLQLPANGMRLFYINREMCAVVGPEELKCGTRALHSYSIRDGDEILVVPKVKSRCSSSDLWPRRWKLWLDADIQVVRGFQPIMNVQMSTDLQDQRTFRAPHRWKHQNGFFTCTFYGLDSYAKTAVALLF